MHYASVLACLSANTEGYKLYILRGLQREVVSGDYSGNQRIIQNYTEGYIIIYIPWIELHMGHLVDLI